MGTGSDGSGEPTVTLPDGRTMTLSQYQQYVHSLPSDELVTVERNGQVTTMTVAQYQQEVDQVVRSYVGQVETTMSTSILSLQGLADELWSQSGEVNGVLSRLQSQLADLESAFGTDQVGTALKGSWGRAWTQLSQALGTLAKNLSTVGDGLSHAADTVFQAEQANLRGFGITVRDPRAPVGSRRGFTPL